jgi:hypothetical protein
MKLIFIILSLLIILCIVYTILKSLQERFGDDDDTKTKNALVLSTKPLLDFRLVLNENNPITITTDFDIVTNTSSIDDIETDTTILVPETKILVPTKANFGGSSLAIKKIQVNGQYVTISSRGDITDVNNHVIFYTSQFLFHANLKLPMASLFLKQNQLCAYFSKEQEYNVQINSNGVYFNSQPGAVVLQKTIKPNFNYINFDTFESTVQLSILKYDLTGTIISDISGDGDDYYYADLDSHKITKTNPNYTFKKVYYLGEERYVISPQNDPNSYYAAISYYNTNDKISTVASKFVPLKTLYFGALTDTCDAPFEIPFNACVTTIFLKSFSGYLKFTYEQMDQNKTKIETYILYPVDKKTLYATEGDITVTYDPNDDNILLYWLDLY